MQTQGLRNSLDQPHFDGTSPSCLDILWLELTTKCNLSCVHCYADSGPQKPMHDKLQLGDWMKAMLQASQLGCGHFIFIGGEPTLYPGLPDLLEYGESLRLDTMEVFTNGCTLSDRLKEAFRRYSVDLAFSVYALYEKIHDAITGRAGSLVETLSSVRWALDAGLNIRVAVIEMEANAGTTEATRVALIEMGVTSIRIDRIRGIGRGLRKENPPQSLFGELCGRCGRNRLCLASSGQLFPCVFSRFHPVGSLDLGLAATLEGPELHSFLSTMEAVQQNAWIKAGGGDGGGGGCATGEEPCPPDKKDWCLPDFCAPLKNKCGPDFCAPQIEPRPPVPCAVVRG